MAQQLKTMELVQIYLIKKKYNFYQFSCLFSVCSLDPDPGGKINADPDPQP